MCVCACACACVRAWVRSNARASMHLPACARVYASTRLHMDTGASVQTKCTGTCLCQNVRSNTRTLRPGGRFIAIDRHSQYGRVGVGPEYCACVRVYVRSSARLRVCAPGQHGRGHFVHTKCIHIYIYKVRGARMLVLCACVRSSARLRVKCIVPRNAVWLSAVWSHARVWRPGAHSQWTRARRQPWGGIGGRQPSDCVAVFVRSVVKALVSLRAIELVSLADACV